jgi:ketosteroid isomerase-like protein
VATSSQTNEAVAAELVRLENERCRAFRELDHPAIEALLSDDYSHVHMNGHMEDKAAFMAIFKNRQRVIRREQLNIRVHGDAAIMTGRMFTTRQTENGTDEIDSFATQTWIKEDDGWKLAAIQVCPYTE